VVFDDFLEILELKTIEKTLEFSPSLLLMPLDYLGIYHTSPLVNDLHNH
jgi:hypothetical protein